MPELYESNWCVIWETQSVSHVSSNPNCLTKSYVRCSVNDVGILWNKMTLMFSQILDYIIWRFGYYENWGYNFLVIKCDITGCTHDNSIFIIDFKQITN